MTEDHPVLKYPELMTELKRLCDEGRTGTMFISTIDNQSARFILQEGIISSCSFRMKRGFDALPQIRKIKGGRFTFADGFFSAMEELVLPNTKDLLGVLTSGFQETGQHNGKAHEPASGNSGAATILGIIKHELALQIGPVAEMCCEDYLEDEGKPGSSEAIQHMINVLAREISDPVKQHEFKQHIMDKIRH